MDLYVELDKETMANLKKLKESLMEKAGLVQDPFIVGKLFISCCQHPDERVEN